MREKRLKKGEGYALKREICGPNFQQAQSIRRSYDV
jgi:hypothetical protein